MSELLPQLRHHLQCTLGRVLSKNWPAAELAAFQRESHHGRSRLEGGSHADWKALVYRPAEDWNGRVLWYFHGFCGQGDFTTGRSAPGTREIYRRFRDGKPVIVGITFGDSWLLNRRLLAAILPAMAEICSASKLPRDGGWLLGFSMGGFNALRILAAAADSGFSFEKCVVVAPCLPVCDPHADPRELRACLKRGSGSSLLKRRSCEMVRQFFPTRNDWSAASPEHAFGDRENSQILIVVGKDDGFGFSASSSGLAKTIDAELLSFEGKHTVPSDGAAVRKIVAFYESPVGQQCPA